MPTYSVNFINNSQGMGSACLYQKSSGYSYGQFSLAWFARTVYPGSQAMFQWQPDYSFVCSQSGMLMPGAMFEIYSQVSTDPNGANMVTLNQYGGLQFDNPTPGGQPGSLSIRTGSSIQPGQASAGIGMSGAATFAAQAQPNMMYNFGANPTYWLTFGNYQQGQVLDTNSIGNSVQLNFGGSAALTVTLNPDGTYTVQNQ